MPTASTAKKVTTPRKRRTRKASTPKTTDKVIKEIQAVLDAPTPKSLDKVLPPLNTPVAKSVVTEDVKQESKVKTVVNKIQQLNGIDFVILPLIYLEAFVVNFLQNLEVKVPERVAIK